jgi:RNA-directed DNA polymerase
MIKASISLQDLRKRIYIKAKADKTWRFWGLYVHVCKMETLREAYRMAKRNNGAPGIDGVTFQDIESTGVESYLQQIRDELVAETYRPMRYRSQDIPKGNGGVRTLKIPAIRDRVVQGALKLILEPIFEADFQEGSYGYRPKRTPHQAVQRVTLAALDKTHVLDVDLKSYFDTIRHDILLGKVAERVEDKSILHLLKLILKAGGKRGVAQGGPLSPLLSNLYLNQVDKMLERAKEVTWEGRYTRIEYARFADDLVVLVDRRPNWYWLLQSAYQRLEEELAKLGVRMNSEKTRILDLRQGDSFTFLGFQFHWNLSAAGERRVYKRPTMKARTALIRKLKEQFHRYRSRPVKDVIAVINPILRGWVNYFRIGNSSRCFHYVRHWVDKKVRRHLMRARGEPGFGWNRWSREWLHRDLGLYGDYGIRYLPKALPAR